MKKLITLLSALTLTSSIVPLTVACKTKSVLPTSNPNPNLNERTAADKIKDAKATLINFKDLEMIEAKIDKLKTQIKLKIENGLNKKDNVTIEGNIKICKKNSTVELKDADITANEIEITVTADFKVEEVTEQFTLNTKVKLVSEQTMIDDAVKLLNDINEEPVELLETDLTFTNLIDAIKNLNKYTSVVIGEVALKNDLILKKQNGTVLDSNDTVAFDDVIFVKGKVQVGKIDKDFVFSVKVQEAKGIDLSKITADMIINWKDEYEWGGKKYNSNELGKMDKGPLDMQLGDNLRDLIIAKIFGIERTKYDDFTVFNKNITDADKKNNIISRPAIISHIFKTGVEYNSKDENDKNFTISINLLKWSKCVDVIQSKLKSMQSDVQKFLEMNLENQKKYISDNYSNKTDSEIQKLVEEKVKESELTNQINLDLIKSAYDRIKGTSAIIKIDLNNQK